MAENEKILVCITAQTNSRRLIDSGNQVASSCDGELHILHVLKGDSVFVNEETPILLEELFDYGKKEGGMIHAYCDNNVPKSIGRFVRTEKMTKIILGEPPRDAVNPETHFKAIVKEMPEGVELIILNRQKSGGYTVYTKQRGHLNEVSKYK